MSELHDELVFHLCNGNSVHLEGIGYFRLTLSAPKEITPTTASRHLKRLLEEGRLRNTNTKQSPVYEPVKGFYGK